MNSGVTNPASIDALRRAQQMAQAGDLAGAANICRTVILREPQNFYALLILGGIESDRRNFMEAEKQLDRAVHANPRSPEALGLYGNVLIERGRRDAGIRALTEALRLQPQNPATYVYRGFGYAQGGDHKRALADFDAALRLSPNWEFALHNRASALIALNRHGEARADVENLLRRTPSNVAVLTNYALILIRESRHAEALPAIDRALALDPRNAMLLRTRASVLLALNRPADALDALERALRLVPGDTALEIARANALAAYHREDEALRLFETLAQREPANPEIALNCANFLMDHERLEEALRWTGDLTSVNPDYAPGWTLRGNLLLHLERYDESFSAYERAVAVGEDYPEAVYHRGSILLLHGRFTEGWRDFERRWDVADCGFTRPVLRGPEWRGENLAGRSIVIYSEQGLGDTIQFVRFVPQLLQRGARVTFICHPGLIRLFRRFAEMGIEVIGSSRADRQFDFQCALMSLPQRFGTTLATLPSAVPYLFPETSLVDSWGVRLGPHGVRVGICWQGNPAGKVDRGRSVPLRHYIPLAGIPGVRLISLQRSHGLDQLARVPANIRIESPGEFDQGKDAFLDTAAIMQNLDLIVTSDTSVAHLAGALGRPVWVAVKHTPDWRWMLDRTDSPWYPTMRLFRQKLRHDWNGVFDEITEALGQFVTGTVP